MWAVAVVLYLLGYSLARDAYRATIPHDPNDRGDRGAMLITTLLWPVTEAYDLFTSVFGDKEQGG